MVAETFNMFLCSLFYVHDKYLGVCALHSLKSIYIHTFCFGALSSILNSENTYKLFLEYYCVVLQ